MATLAIKGHATRGSEVIGLLEMLGGRNEYHLSAAYSTQIYYINEDNFIDTMLDDNSTYYSRFTLEQFFEKFPYKVGDKVTHKGGDLDYTISRMKWVGDKVEYFIDYDAYNGLDAYACDLQPYTEQKEESMKERIDKNIEKYNNGIFRCHFDSVTERIQVIPNKDYELKAMNGDYFFIKKRPQYPKTYEECLKVLGYMTDMSNCKGYKGELLESFQRLLICRDAYWNIAGDWKPEFRFGKKKCCIMTKDNKVITATIEETNRILTFPTEEMRDAFYENFKSLIEECKELL